MNLENYWDQEKLKENKNNIKKIFFFRICGMGMGACATLLKSSGFQVEGADSVFFPPMSDYLIQEDIKCFKLDEVTNELLKDYDLIVVGNSVGGKSDDARMIENCGTPFTSFPSLMGELILKNRQVVGIAGTHGKTTTTYYLAQMLENLGESPGHFVGGVIDDGTPSKSGTGRFFVIESDEYDSSYFQKYAKFRSYEINHLILTSLEFDHADIYNSTDEIENEFKQIIPNLSSFIGNTDYKCVGNLLSEVKAPSLSYGMDSGVGPLNIKYDNGLSYFDVAFAGEKFSFVSSVIGDHNLLNLTSCILFCFHNNFAYEDVRDAVKKLRNVKRRQEYRGKYQESLVVDDFAHHPTSVLLTIDAIRKAYPGKKVHCVIEPSTSTSRSVAFQDTFVESFLGAASLIICNPKLPTNAKQYENLDFDKLVKDVNEKMNIETKCVSELSDLRSMIDKRTKEESVLLVMGNRTILGLWESDFVKELT